MSMPNKRGKRRVWIQGARAAVSVILLAVLISRIDFETLIVPNRSLPGSLAFLIGGLILMALSFVVAAERWQRVLAVYHAVVPLRTLTQHYLAGQFVGNVLPSTIGGDVLRVSRSSKDVGSTEVAFGAVAIERLTGFVALPLLTLIGFIARRDLITLARSWVALLIAGVAILLLVVLLLLAASPRIAGRYVHNTNWMRFIGIIHIGIGRMRADPRDALEALAAAVVYQLMVVGAVYCAIHTVGADVPNGAVLAFIPAVAMIQVLPISLGGLGVREAMLAFLLHPLGVPTGQAVAIGLLWYAMTLIVSLVGAPAFAIGHRQDRAATQQ